MRFFKTLILVSVWSTLILPAFVFADDEDEEEKVPVSYYKLEPSIVANLSDGAKYIRCDIQLMTKNGENLPDIELHSPALRHEMFMLLSDQKGKALKSKNGQEKLRKVALKSLQQVMTELSGENRIDDLFFTFYVVQ